MKYQKIIIIMAIMAVPFSLLSAGPHHGRHSKGGFQDEAGGPGRFFMDLKFLKNRLDLSDQQTREISDLNKNFRVKMQKSLMNENGDQQQVKTQLEKMASLKVEIGMLMLSHRLEIEKKLEPAQKRKLTAIMQEKFKRFSERQGFPGDDCPCMRNK